MDVDGKILRERPDRINRTISLSVGFEERPSGGRFKSRPHVHPEIPMKILFASAEASPLTRVGGLGEVAGSLPKALTALGHDVRIVMPRYGTIKGPHEEVTRFPVRLGNARHEAGLRTARIGEVPVYLVDKPDLYDRPKVYEYDNDGKRFGFFCKAILDLISAADFWPDVIHTNDWPSALLPAFLRSAMADDPRFQRIGAVLT